MPIVGLDINLAPLAPFLALAAAILRFQGMRNVLDRVLNWLRRLHVIAFIGKEEGQIVEAIPQTAPDRTVTWRAAPGAAPVRSSIGYQAGLGLRAPSREIIKQEPDQYFLRTVERREAGPLVYLPMAALVLAWLVAGVLDSKWLLLPFWLWPVAISEFSSVEFGLLSLIKHLSLGLVYAALALLISMTCLTLSVTATIRTLSAFAECAGRFDWHGWLGSFLALAAALCAITAA